MKIAILTHPLGANYGGILQAYALSKYLEAKGHCVTVLNLQHELYLYKRVIKSILVALRHPRYNNPKYKNLNAFVKRNINYSVPLTSQKQLKKYIERKNFDLFIVGSDQVWRADFARKYGYNYFLDFAPNDSKKISYAASFGLSDWCYTAEETTVIKSLLNRFSAISVREDEGVKLCEKFLDINATQLIDPTMLLTSGDYDKLSLKREYEDSYTYVYWLGDEKEKAKALSSINQEGKRVVDISLRANDTLIPVEQWVSNIKYSDFVVTDSFHGLVFSILFNKRFRVCSNKSGGNGRISSLLSLLGIALKDDGSCYDFDYAIVNDRINQLRSTTQNFFEAL